MNFCRACPERQMLRATYELEDVKGEESEEAVNKTLSGSLGWHSYLFWDIHPSAVQYL